MTRLPRPTLRALRSVVARALGVRRSRVRVVERADVYLPRCRELVVRLVATGRDPGSDWWAVMHGRLPPHDARESARYVARRAWAGDMP